MGVVGVVGDSPRTPEGGQAGKRWWNYGSGGNYRSGGNGGSSGNGGSGGNGAAICGWWEFSERLGVLGKGFEK